MGCTFDSFVSATVGLSTHAPNAKREVRCPHLLLVLLAAAAAALGGVAGPGVYAAARARSGTGVAIGFASDGDIRGCRGAEAGAAATEAPGASSSITTAGRKSKGSGRLIGDSATSVPSSTGMNSQRAQYLGSGGERAGEHTRETERGGA